MTLQKLRTVGVQRTRGKMKQLLKRWLDIPESIPEYEIHREIKVYTERWVSKRLEANLIYQVRRALSDIAQQEVTEKLNTIINREDFIDEVVQRIKVKQL